MGAVLGFLLKVTVAYFFPCLTGEPVPSPCSASRSCLHFSALPYITPAACFSDSPRSVWIVQNNLPTSSEFLLLCSGLLWGPSRLVSASLPWPWEPDDTSPLRSSPSCLRTPGPATDPRVSLWELFVPILSCSQQLLVLTVLKDPSTYSFLLNHEAHRRTREQEYEAGGCSPLVGEVACLLFSPSILSSLKTFLLPPSSLTPWLLKSRVCCIWIVIKRIPHWAGNMD